MSQRIDIASHLTARLQADTCAGQLCEYYADQVFATGTKTTPDDALGAWCKWLESQGGRCVHPPKVSDWKNGFHERVALAIREVARYQQNPS
jgi:hypothetical protein